TRSAQPVIAYKPTSAIEWSLPSRYSCVDKCWSTKAKRASKECRPEGTILRGQPSRTLCVESEPLVLQITDIIDADDVAACIADWRIASDVRLAQDVDLSEIAFALRNSRDGF